MSGAMAVTKSTYPLNTLWSDIYGRNIAIKLGTDNSTAQLDVIQGWSKGMKHLRRHQRLSIGLFADSLDDDDCDLEKWDSGENTTDIFTKPLGAQKFVYHRKGLGVQ